MPIGSGGGRRPPKFKTVGKSAGKATIKGKDVARAVSKVKRSRIITTNSWKLTLNNSDRKVKRLVRRASVNLLKDKFAEILGYAAADFVEAVKEEITAELEEWSFIKDLLHGDRISSELGITDEMLGVFESNLDKLFQVRIDQRLSNSSIHDGMPVVALDIIPYPKEEDLSDASIGFAYYTENGELQKWVRHFLYGEAGYNPGYQVIDARGFGRTNLKIMVKTDGKEYELDSTVEGKQNQNWIRDLIQEMTGDLQLIFRKILESHIQEEIKFKKNIRSR